MWRSVCCGSAGAVPRGFGSSPSGAGIRQQSLAEAGRDSTQRGGRVLTLRRCYCNGGNCAAAAFFRRRPLHEHIFPVPRQNVPPFPEKSGLLEGRGVPPAERPVPPGRWNSMESQRRNNGGQTAVGGQGRSSLADRPVPRGGRGALAVPRGGRARPAGLVPARRLRPTRAPHETSKNRFAQVQHGEEDIFYTFSNHSADIRHDRSIPRPLNSRLRCNSRFSATTIADGTWDERKLCREDEEAGGGLHDLHRHGRS